MEHEQVARFLARIPEPPALSDFDNPSVVFSSPLGLNRDQEQALVDHALGRIRSLEEELGRNTAYSDNWYAESAVDATSTSKSFMASRQLAEMTYHGRMEWRRHVVGGIFNEHNLTVPLARRIVQQQHSRANDYFFSTDPWFAVGPVGRPDQEKARSIQRYARWMFEKSQVKGALMKAVELAFMRGEQILKPSMVNRSSRYESWATVAVDSNGEPIVADDQDYIYEDDEWVQPELGVVDGMGGAPLENELAAPALVLKRDGRTPHPGGSLTFEHRKVWKRLQMENGIEMGLVYYKDFLCPLSAPSVDEADCVVHFYDKPTFDIVTEHLGDLEGENGIPGEDYAKVINLLQEWQSADPTPKAERNKPRASLGETSNLTDHSEHEKYADGGNPVVEVAEVYLHYDANEDGDAESIFMLLDVANEKPIYYDYLENVTPDGKRPFHVVRVNPVDGRWHGIGQVETFWNLQEYADLLQNRWSQAQSGSGHIDIIQPDTVEEADANGNVEINGGDAYHLKPNKRAEDFITRLPLYDHRSGGIQNEMQWVMQLAMNMSGIMNANDSRMVGLDSGKLATGVNNIERSGQELFGPFLQHLEPGIRDAVRSALLLLVANINDEEPAEFFENNDEPMPDEFQLTDMADLDLDVTLELTRYKGEQELQQTTSAEQAAVRFYNLPPDVQKKLAPLYRQQLRLFEIQNVDELIQPMVPPAPEQPPMGPAGMDPMAMNSMAMDPAPTDPTAMNFQLDAQMDPQLAAQLALSENSEQLPVDPLTLLANQQQQGNY